MTRDQAIPTRAQRFVLLTLMVERCPYEAGGYDPDTVEKGISQCESNGWIKPSYTPAWYEVTTAGMGAINR